MRFFLPSPKKLLFLLIYMLIPCVNSSLSLNTTSINLPQHQWRFKWMMTSSFTSSSLYSSDANLNNDDIDQNDYSKDYVNDAERSVSIPLTTLENPDHVPQDLKEIMRNMSRKLPKDFENGSLTEDYVEEIKQELNDAAAEDDVESTTITLPYRDIEHYIEVMRVDAVNIMELVLYTLEFVIGTVGNSFALYKHLSHMKKGNKSRVNLLILHLIIADLMVMWLVVLIEIIWRYTVIWIMGDIMCRLLSAFKTFVMYLTSNLVVCVALDRYYALVKPLSFVHADRRNNFFLIISYILAAFCSIPQVFVFRLVTSQRLEGFKQCLTTGAFGTSEWLQNSYTITSIIIMFFIPLMIISYCYWKIFRRVDEAARPTFSLASDTAANSKTATAKGILEPSDDEKNNRRGVTADDCEGRMSRNRSQRMETARSNALLMSIVIVVAFIICWAPYSTLAILLHVDFAKDHLQIPNWLSQLIFVSAYSSSCVNPFVHSSHYLIGCDLCNSQETTSQTTAASNANLNRSRNKKTHHRHRRENDPDDDELELNRMNHQYQMDNGETDTIVHRVTTVITVDVMDEMKSGTGNIETVV